MRGYFTFLMLLSSSGLLCAQLLNPVKNGAKNIRAVETSFELAGGLIFIAGDSDAPKEGDYLLDTGAPTLILNQKEKDAFPKAQMVSVNGNAAVGNKKVRDFAVRGVNLGNVNSYTTDLSHLERVKQKSICGILGYKVFRSLELFIDYDKRYLMLFENGASALHREVLPQEEVKFCQKGHFPIVKVIIDGKKYFFGIDTGAEVNVFDERWLRRMKRKFPEEWTKKTIQGINQGQMTRESCLIPNMKVGQTNYEEMKFVFADLSHLNHSNGFELDGILGFPFLSSGKFSINYKNKRLYRWDNPLEELAGRMITDPQVDEPQLGED